jgi:hypothetical protein
MAQAGGKGELSEHPLVAKLRPDPNKPYEPTVKLAGYVGRSTEDGKVRLYPTLDDLSTYLDIRREDIVHAEAAPESVLEHGGTYVWVKQSAEVTQGQTQTTKVQAQFLGGPIAEAHLAPEEAALGGIAPAPITAITVCGAGTCFRTVCGFTCVRTVCFGATCIRTICGGITCLRTACGGATCFRTLCGATCLRTVCGQVTCQIRTCFVTCATCHAIQCGLVSQVAICQLTVNQPCVLETAVCPSVAGCPTIQCGPGGGFDPGPMF